MVYMFNQVRFCFLFKLIFISFASVHKYSMCLLCHAEAQEIQGGGEKANEHMTKGPNGTLLLYFLIPSLFKVLSGVQHIS